MPQGKSDKFDFLFFMNSDANSAIKSCSQRLEKAGSNNVVISNFERLHGLVSSGVTGIIADNTIEPLASIPSYAALANKPELNHAAAPFSELVVCKLNGGLGTSMGLKQAKSLLHVRLDPQLGRRLSFNEINARQIGLLGKDVPFLNMVSFSTDADVRKDLEKSSLESDRLFYLMQNIHPKIYADTFSAAEHEDDSLCWNPPGHGDFYQAFYASGQLEQFVKQGKKYLFVSNADNLSAYPSPLILNYIAANKIPFLMEVTTRTEADKKGGHLARRKSDGRIILRESAQAETDERGQIAGDFQDIKRHTCFNINSLWLNLESLLAVMREKEGVLPLPLIRNKKTLDPRDEYSPEVFQLETAMGAAIEFFEGAELLEVGRERFAPVKTCNDLLLVLSDCYALDAKGLLVPQVNPLPQITLSSEYKLIDDFEKLITVVPSLKDANRFAISGNIKIEFALTIVGNVSIEDQRSDRSEAYVLKKVHERLQDLKLVVNDQGEELSPIS